MRRYFLALSLVLFMALAGCSNSGGEYADKKLHELNLPSTVDGIESQTMHAAIDLAVDKLERQARKLHGKIVDKHNGQSNAVVPAEMQSFRPPLTPDEEQAAESGAGGAIVKRKRVELKPMTHDEAIEQLELLNHDFFIFGSETGEMNVLYRRRDGDYGLIEPRYS